VQPNPNRFAGEQFSERVKGGEQRFHNQIYRLANPNLGSNGVLIS